AQMAGALEDAPGHASRLGTPPLDDRRSVDLDADDPERRRVQVVVVLGVRRRRLDHLGDVAGSAARREPQDDEGLPHGKAFDHLRHQARLARRGPHPFRSRDDFHLAAYFSAELRSVWCPWPRYRLVAANSPSLCPTMASVTNSGTCLRPS